MDDILKTMPVFGAFLKENGTQLPALKSSSLSQEEREQLGRAYKTYLQDKHIPFHFDEDSSFPLAEEDDKMMVRMLVNIFYPLLGHKKLKPTPGTKADTPVPVPPNTDQIEQLTKGMEPQGYTSRRVASILGEPRIDVDIRPFSILRARGMFRITAQLPSGSVGHLQPSIRVFPDVPLSAQYLPLSAVPSVVLSAIESPDSFWYFVDVRELLSGIIKQIQGSGKNASLVARLQSRLPGIADGTVMIVSASYWTHVLSAPYVCNTTQDPCIMRNRYDHNQMLFAPRLEGSDDDFILSTPEYHLGYDAVYDRPMWYRKEGGFGEALRFRAAAVEPGVSYSLPLAANPADYVDYLTYLANNSIIGLDELNVSPELIAVFREVLKGLGLDLSTFSGGFTTALTIGFAAGSIAEGPDVQTLRYDRGTNKLTTTPLSTVVEALLTAAQNAKSSLEELRALLEEYSDRCVPDCIFYCQDDCAGKTSCVPCSDCDEFVCPKQKWIATLRDMATALSKFFQGGACTKLMESFDVFESSSFSLHLNAFSGKTRQERVVRQSKPEYDTFYAASPMTYGDAEVSLRSRQDDTRNFIVTRGVQEGEPVRVEESKIDETEDKPPPTDKLVVDDGMMIFKIQTDMRLVLLSATSPELCVNMLPGVSPPDIQEPRWEKVEYAPNGDVVAGPKCQPVMFLHMPVEAIETLICKQTSQVTTDLFGSGSPLEIIYGKSGRTFTGMWDLENNQCHLRIGAEALFWQISADVDAFVDDIVQKVNRLIGIATAACAILLPPLNVACLGTLAYALLAWIDPAIAAARDLQRAVVEGVEYCMGPVPEKSTRSLKRIKLH